MKNFRTYQIAVDFYHQSQSLRVKRHLKDQLSRAASSIVLNLAEGAGRFGRKDQKKFFNIAFASLRECQAVLDLERINNTLILDCADNLAAHLFKLIKSCD